MLDKYLDLCLGEHEEQPQRKLKSDSTQQQQTEEQEDETESVLKKTQRDLRQDKEQKIVKEVKVGDIMNDRKKDI